MAVAAVAAAAALASTAVQAKAAADEASAKQTASLYNQKRDQENADLAVQQGNEEARRADLIAGRTLGQSKAAAGASGVQMSGSALDVINQNAQNAELNHIQIIHNATIKQRGYLLDSSAEDLKQNAAINTQGTQTAGALIGGGAKAYGYLNYKQDDSGSGD